MKRTIIAIILILRNPFTVWKYGGWQAAKWAAQSGFGSVKYGVPYLIELVSREISQLNQNQ